MSIQSIVDYGLIIVFFIAIAALVPFVLIRSEAPHDETDEVDEKAQRKTFSSKTSGLAYGLTAILFALFIAVTFIIRRGHGDATSV